MYWKNISRALLFCVLDNNTRNLIMCWVLQMIHYLVHGNIDTKRENEEEQKFNAYLDF
jgi:hypothetical protein